MWFASYLFMNVSWKWVHRIQRKPFICHYFTPEGGVLGSESLHKVCKNTAGAWWKTTGVSLSCSPQHFTSQKTLLELCATVKETSPSLIEMDFQEYSSADGLFSGGEARSDKRAPSEAQTDASRLLQSRSGANCLFRGRNHSQKQLIGSVCAGM